jgi:hypothetical protein
MESSDVRTSTPGPIRAADETGRPAVQGTERAGTPAPAADPHAATPGGQDNSRQNTSNKGLQQDR